MAATMSGLNASDYGLKPGSVVGQEIDADATGGRSKCMPARQLARSGRGRRKRQFPVSDAASRKIHPRAERRRRSASEARFSSHARRRGAGPPPVCRRHAGCPHQQLRAPRARLFAQSFRTPLGEEGTEKTGKPWGRTRHGAMTHVRIRSPDELQRHPGWDSASELPHIAALMRATTRMRVGLFDN